LKVLGKIRVNTLKGGNAGDLDPLLPFPHLPCFTSTAAKRNSTKSTGREKIYFTSSLQIMGGSARAALI